jgi:hypothetical protein
MKQNPDLTDETEEWVSKVRNLLEQSIYYTGSKLIVYQLS